MKYQLQQKLRRNSVHGKKKILKQKKISIK